MTINKINFDYRESLREKNYPAYFSLLLMPKKTQQKLEVLWGLATEIRGVPLLVTNPLMGFMRLSMWREQLPDLNLVEAEDWLNSYEVFFDEQIDLHNSWQKLIVPEALLMQQSLRLLDFNASEEMLNHAYKLGLCLGIIYLLQNDYKFGIAAKNNLKEQMYQQLKTYLDRLKVLNVKVTSQHPLFYLMGYCQTWVEKYKHNFQPVTLTEGRIQWAILKQKFKIWQKAIF